MSDEIKHYGDPIEFCGDQEGWIAVASLSDDSPLSPCPPRVVLLGVGLGPSGKQHDSNIAAMLTIEQATDLRERLTAAMGIDRPAPTATPGLDLAAVEAAERAMTPGPWRGSGCSFGHGIVQRNGSGFAHGFQDDAPCTFDVGATNAAGIVALRNAAPALIAEVRALQAEVAERRETASRQLAAIARHHDRISAKLAEAKRLGRDACELAKAYADDAREYGGGDTAAADAIAAALEAL